MSDAQKTGNVGATVGQLSDVDSTARNPLGTVSFDGFGGVYVYLTGIVGTVVGSVVLYNHLSITSLILPDISGPVAVAMAIAVAGKFGWYCIKSPEGGVPALAAATVVSGLPCYIDAGTTNGQVDDDIVAGDLVAGMFFRSTTTAGLATVQFDHAFTTNSLS